MNKVYSFLIFLFCFSYLFAVGKVNPSSYSLLFESKVIRTDIVDKALINLPKKEFVDVLLMFLKMKDAKQSYNLTDEEFAYLAYKWIGQNIEVNYETSSYFYMNVYNFRKGSPWAISDLFNRICSFGQVESKTIFGYVKVGFNYTNGLFSYLPSAWNYIVIDGSKYLVDPSFGAGYYIEDAFEKFNSDLFFGTKPEIFINYHLPHYNEYIFLSQPIIELEKFEYLPMIDFSFYLRGFKSFYPDYRDIKSNQEIKIELAYDDSIEDTNIYCMLFNETYRSPYYEYIEAVKSNGKYVMTLNQTHSEPLYAAIFTGYNNNTNNNIYTIHTPFIILYRLIP